MTKSDEQNFSYTAGLKAAERDLPVLVDLLGRSEANRVVRFKALSGTAGQLRALEEILTYTKELEVYFRSEEQVSQVAFLLRRVHGDFATAIDATFWIP
jgi:hypothetical protein